MHYLVEKDLPFSFQPLAADARCESEPMNNLVFALLECLGDGLPSFQSQDPVSDIERLEHKLNLVIFMINNLIQPTASRPASQRVRLGADAISWQVTPPLSEGQAVLFEIFLNPMMSIPLRCCAQVIEQQDGWCCAKLIGLPEEGMSAWSRWVFRQHRHFVAHSRDVGQSTAH